MTKPTTPAMAWTDDELRTLIAFRLRVGWRWKSTLLNLYLAGTDDREPEGSGLRRIRNRMGPSRVDAITGRFLDAATVRLYDDMPVPGDV